MLATLGGYLAKKFKFSEELFNYHDGLPQLVNFWAQMHMILVNIYSFSNAYLNLTYAMSVSQQVSQITDHYNLASLLNKNLIWFLSIISNDSMTSFTASS